MSHYEIVKLLSQEFNMPKEQVDTIITDFWNAIKDFLENPLQSFTKGVIIKGLITFELRSIRWMQNKIRVLEDDHYRYKNSIKPKSDKQVEACNVEAEKLRNFINHKTKGNG